MSTQNNKSLIILGNTGVGKSAAINAFLGFERFESKDSVVSVTRKLEYEYLETEETLYKVYNLPGLLEDDEKRIQENKTIIQTALDMKEDVYLYYMLTVESGRTRNDDIVAFKALNKAYSLESKKLSFIVNKCEFDLKEKNEDTWRVQTALRFKEMMMEAEVYFIHKDTNKQNFTFEIQQCLSYSLTVQESGYIKKLKELTLGSDIIVQIRKELREQIEKYELLLEKQTLSMQKEINKLQKEQIELKVKFNEEKRIKDELIAAEKVKNLKLTEQLKVQQKSHAWARFQGRVKRRH